MRRPGDVFLGVSLAKGLNLARSLRGAELPDGMTRRAIAARKNMVFWITGLSGAGKTTLAVSLQSLIRRLGAEAVRLDGDEMRWAVGDPRCGHDRASRIVNAYRISRLAKVLAEQGVPVVVSTMSLFHEVHAWNRRNLPGYFEVFLRVNLETVGRRDPKGLYGMAGQGLMPHVGGIDVEVEEPLAPDLVLDNDRDLPDPLPLAAAILHDARLRFPSRLPDLPAFLEDFPS